MMVNPLVSVIIVSYNTRELTVKSIQSIYSSKGLKKTDVEVILVDNNSTDDTVSSIKKKFPQVKIIINKINFGFGKGNNQGVKAAKGKYVLLLNTDAFLGKNSLKEMLEAIEKDSNVISVGPQLLSFSGHVQPSAGYLPTPLRVLGWMWWLDKLPLIKIFFPNPYHQDSLDWYKNKNYPDWLMGACVLFRRSEYLEVGGFDEKIFMYAEEVELYLRLNNKYCKQVLFLPYASVTHLGQASSVKADTSALTNELEGILYLYQKHYPQLVGLIKFILRLGIMARVIVFSLIPNRRSTAKDYIKYLQKK